MYKKTQLGSTNNERPKKEGILAKEKLSFGGLGMVDEKEA